MDRESGRGAVVEDTEPAVERTHSGFCRPLRSIGAIQIGNRCRISLDCRRQSLGCVGVHPLDAGDRPPVVGVRVAEIVQLHPHPQVCTAVRYGHLAGDLLPGGVGIRPRSHQVVAHHPAAGIQRHTANSNPRCTAVTRRTGHAKVVHIPRGYRDSLTVHVTVPNLQVMGRRTPGRGPLVRSVVYISVAVAAKTVRLTGVKVRIQEQIGHVPIHIRLHRSDVRRQRAHSVSPSLLLRADRRLQHRHFIDRRLQFHRQLIAGDLISQLLQQPRRVRGQVQEGPQRSMGRAYLPKAVDMAHPDVIPQHRTGLNPKQRRRRGAQQHGLGV